MASPQSSLPGLGAKAPDFDLPGTDGVRHSLASSRGPNGLLVMFICNHCPYVKAVRERIVRDCEELAGHGIGSIAIMSNDPAAGQQISRAMQKRTVMRATPPSPRSGSAATSFYELRKTRVILTALFP